jgi:di/tricarboxylate transporter
MTLDQAIVFGLLAAAFAGFILQPVRYDVVALLLLLSLVIFGFVQPGEAFGGFAEPAVITVAAVLAISRGLLAAGAVDLLIRALAPLRGRPNAQIVAQTGLVTTLSGFMNNIGALALVLPVALRNAAREGYSPSRALMPLAFGSLLGGLITLIGTPPNLIVSALRQQYVGAPYELFDFAWVGLPIAVVGVVVMLLLAPVLLPRGRSAGAAASAAATVSDYVAEGLAVPGSRAIGLTVRALESLVDGNVVVVGLFRGEETMLAPEGGLHIAAGDALLLEGPPDAIKTLVESAGLRFDTGEPEHRRAFLAGGQVEVIEAVVRPGSQLIGRSPTLLRLRLNHGINVLAASRQGRRVEQRMAHLKIRPGDVLLLQVRRERMAEAFSALGLLPLADRAVTLGRPRRAALSAGLFLIGILAVLLEVLPAQVAFPAVVVAMLVLGVMKPDEAYASVDWSVIVLLGALFPLGIALERTGAIRLLVDSLAGPAGDMPAWMVVAGIILLCMILSEVMANNATVLMMAPIAFGVAQSIGLSADAALMAVCIGTSCTFLSPIGHQSNTVVMEPGGYRFADYPRFGLPVALVAVAVGTPMILWVWG